MFSQSLGDKSGILLVLFFHTFPFVWLFLFSFFLIFFLFLLGLLGIAALLQSVHDDVKLLLELGASYGDNGNSSIFKGLQSFAGSLVFLGLLSRHPGALGSILESNLFAETTDERLGCIDESLL